MAEYINAIDLRRGQTIIWKGGLYMVLDHSFNKTAMRGGIVKCKVKCLKTKSITIEDFSGNKFEKAMIEKVDVIFSYEDNGILHFMDQTSYLDIEVNADDFRDDRKFLEDGTQVVLSMWEGEVLHINFPELVLLTIDRFEDDLPSSDQKKAVTTTGLSLIVPRFCEVGEQILVSTSDGKYRSR